MEDNITKSGKSELKLEDRKVLNVTGVLEVINFDEEKINLNTILGALQILGECLKINKIDVKDGNMCISGKIKSLNYKTHPKKKRKKLSIFKKFPKRG